MLTTTSDDATGEVSATVGGVPTMTPPPEPPAVTVTVTPGEVPVKPSASVATAVRTLGMGSPVVGSICCTGLKDTVYELPPGLVGCVATPTKFPSWKNCTWVIWTGVPMVVVLLSVALAVTVDEPPPLIVPPLPGDVIATEGIEPMITVVGAGVSVGVALVVDAMMLFLSS